MSIHKLDMLMSTHLLDMLISEGRGLLKSSIAPNIINGINVTRMDIIIGRS